jgi:high affinity choline transporter 7
MKTSKLVLISAFLWFMFQLLSVPFAYQNDAVSRTALTSSDWIGQVDRADIGEWIDTLLLLMFGGIPWQVLNFEVLARNYFI